MNHRRFNPPARPAAASGFDPGEILKEDLHAMPPAPDLCRSIMARLGYMRQVRGRARRERIIRWMRRTTMIMAVLVTMLVGAWVQQSGLRSGEPDPPTLPDALRNDLHWNVRQINSAIETIRGRLTPVTPAARELPPVPDPPSETPGIDEIIERSARGPGCWV